MKKTLTLMLLILCSWYQAQVCNAGGDLMIFTNYDGGTLTSHKLLVE